MTAEPESVRVHKPQGDDRRLRFAMLGLRVCKSIFWHDRSKPFPKPIRGASCFIVNIRGRYIGVTASHVVDLFRDARRANPETICQIMHATIDLEDNLISQSKRRDIATFNVPSELVDEGLRPGILHYQDWPPPEPVKGALTMFVGFPESMRTITGPSDLQLMAWAGLEIVEDVTSREIIMAYDPTRSRSMLDNQGLLPPTFNLSGCSGGPALIFEPKNDVLEVYASGVITDGPNEGSTGAFAEIAVIHAARLDCMTAEGIIATE